MGTGVRSKIDSWRANKASGGANVSSESSNYPELYGEDYAVEKAVKLRTTIMDEIAKRRDEMLERIDNDEKSMIERGILDDEAKKYLENERKKTAESYETVREYHNEYLMYEKSAQEIYRKYSLGNRDGGAYAIRRMVLGDFDQAKYHQQSFHKSAEYFKKRREGYIQNSKTKEWFKMESHDGYKSYKFVAEIDSKLPADLSGFRVIQGNTYPHREKLKKDGFKWDAVHSRWLKK